MALTSAWNTDTWESSVNNISVELTCSQAPVPCHSWFRSRPRTTPYLIECRGGYRWSTLLCQRCKLRSVFSAHFSHQATAPWVYLCLMVAWYNHLMLRGDRPQVLLQALIRAQNVFMVFPHILLMCFPNSVWDSTSLPGTWPCWPTQRLAAQLHPSNRFGFVSGCEQHHVDFIRVHWQPNWFTPCLHYC